MVNWPFWSCWLICTSYFAEHYCCFQFISIYNNIQDNNQKQQNFLKKNQFKGSNPTTGRPIHLKISGQIDLDLINIFIPMSDFLKMLWFWSYKPKTAFYPYVLFLTMASILVGWPGHRTLFFLNYIPKWWLCPSLV